MTTSSRSQLSAADAAHFSALFDALADTHTGPQGTPGMTQAAFARAVAPAAGSEALRAACAALFGVADSARRGALTKDDFLHFQELLAQHDAASRLAFATVAEPGADSVAAASVAGLSADDAAARSFLSTAGRVPYPEFAELAAAARTAHIRSAFAAAASDGAVAADRLASVVGELAPLDPAGLVGQRLPLLGRADNAAIGYPAFLALVGLLSDPARVRQAVDAAARSQPAGAPEIARQAFDAAGARLSPLEVSVLLTLAAGQRSADAAPLAAIDAVLEACHGALAPAMAPAQDQHAAPKRTAARELLFQAYNFGVGAVAGGIGAAVVYPIDLVKTRMQNQRAAVVGEMMYKNSADCFRKVVRNEGVLGLYRGLGPQLVGVAPEKAIKLTVNDFVRARLTDKSGNIAFTSELIAGASAGASQVVFTNPLEIVKIRLQVQGELLKDAAGAATPIARRGAVTIIKELGLLGLYKGASACLLRDVPFSAIYFSCYSHLKKDVFHEGERQLGIADLLIAGAVAGMPAAYLTTPADVIKTRLQVVAKQGETAYTGLLDAARKIYREEGFRAFFKGGPARILRSSPQFGTTLMCYELIHRALPFPGAEHESPAERQAQRARLASSQASLFHAANALRVLHDSNYRFGAIVPPKPAGASSA